jgi:hypothetical protein
VLAIQHCYTVLYSQDDSARTVVIDCVSVLRIATALIYLIRCEVFVNIRILSLKVVLRFIIVKLDVFL